MSFKMAWKSNGDTAKYEDASKHFHFTGIRDTCQMEAEVQVSSIGFSRKSDPLDTPESAFAVIGEEVNGRYYGV
jgi:hypothetical protein